MTDVNRTPSPQLRETPHPPLDSDEFRQIVIDVAHSRQALAVLASLLHGRSAEVLAGGGGPGLAVLLESPTQRLQLALDALEETATALRIEGVKELTSGP